MRTQLRAICPACFAQQALRDGFLVQHGYRRPQMWHQNVGTCSGTGERHFGTEAGRDYTARLAVGLRKRATQTLETAQAVVDGTADVWGTKRHQNVYVPIKIEAPTELQRRDYSRKLAHEANQLTLVATELEGRVAAWQPAQPVEVVVEEKVMLIHWRTPRRWRGQGKACAGSLMGALKGHSTTDTTRVSCEKCKALIAKWELPA